MHRKFLEWEWYHDHNTTRLFMHLVLRANHKPKRWRGQVIKRGQVLTGRKALSKETGISEQSIRTSMRKLESTGELTSKSTNQYTIITICKYDNYQLKDNATNQQSNKRLTNDQPTTNHKQECKNDKNIVEEEKRGSVPIDLETRYINAIEDESWMNRFYLDYNIQNGKMKMVLGEYGKAQKRMKQSDREQTYNDWCRHFDLWIRKPKNFKRFQSPV